MEPPPRTHGPLDAMMMMVALALSPTFGSSIISRLLRTGKGQRENWRTHHYTTVLSFFSIIDKTVVSDMYVR